MRAWHCRPPANRMRRCVPTGSPAAERGGIVGVFTDIDDTLTTDGAITPDALQALADLKAAGLIVIAITGRPDWLVRAVCSGDAAAGVAPWPVDAIVAENGAVAFRGGNLQEIGLERPSDKREPLSKLYQQDAATRRRTTPACRPWRSRSGGGAGRGLVARLAGARNRHCH